MTYSEMGVNPEDIFYSIEHAVEDIPAKTDRYGYVVKMHELSDEELAEANLYLDLFTKHPAEKISIHWELPAEKDMSSGLVDYEVEAALHHSLGKLTTFFTFCKDAEGSITAFKSFHTEEVEDAIEMPQNPPEDFLTQEWVDNSFKKIREKTESKINIKSIKADEMMALRAILSALYEA